jgi:hypothetical protein
MENNEKIGVGIVTYNSESYFKSLYDSLQGAKIDELVVVNGGNRYENTYDCDWIQHNKNYYPAACRNDCITYLMNRNVDYLFLIEDDQIIKNVDIFQKYIETSKVSGLEYFSFVSMSAGAGNPDNRTPKLTVNYTKNNAISFYQNMCNEFVMFKSSLIKQIGLYDTTFRDAFDVEMTVRLVKHTKLVSPFWYFADLADSDQYIMNNPVAVSRLQASDRPDGSRSERIQEQWGLFHQKHNFHVNQISDTSQEDVIKQLKKIKP